MSVAATNAASRAPALPTVSAPDRPINHDITSSTTATQAICSSRIFQIRCDPVSVPAVVAISSSAPDGAGQHASAIRNLVLPVGRRST